MQSIDDPLDFVRMGVFLVTLYTTVKLIAAWYRHRNDWNQKTLDLWYTLTAWSVAGMVFSVQGVLLGRPLTAGFVFLIAAALVGGKAVHQKGAWGGTGD